MRDTLESGSISHGGAFGAVQRVTSKESRQEERNKVLGHQQVCQP